MGGYTCQKSSHVILFNGQGTLVVVLLQVEWGYQVLVFALITFMQVPISRSCIR